MRFYATLLTVIALTAACSAATAQMTPPLLIQNDAATVFFNASQGSVVVFYGTLTNKTNDILTLDTLNFNINSPDDAYLSADPAASPFYQQPRFPRQLGPNDSTGDQPLFAIDVAPGAPLGVFKGSITIDGQDLATGDLYTSDDNTNPAVDPNGEFTLTVAPAPEPASLLGFAVGAAFVAGLALRRRLRAKPS